MKLNTFTALVAILSLAACTTHTKAESKSAGMKQHQKPHIVTTKSNASFDQTVEQLKAALEARNLKTFAVIDHAAGAASVGTELRPTTLFIFGNPAVGAPLMEAEQRIGMRLPMKMLIYVDANGDVQLSHTDIAHLLHEYGVSDMETRSANIAAALAAIASDAGSSKYP